MIHLMPQFYLSVPHTAPSSRREIEYAINSTRIIKIEVAPSPGLSVRHRSRNDQYPCCCLHPLQELCAVVPSALLYFVESFHSNIKIVPATTFSV